MITKELCKNFRNDFNTAMKELESKYGIAITLGNISYCSTDFSAKITANVTGDEAKEKEKAEFESYAKFYGFEPEDYGKEMTLQGKRFKFVGFNHRCSKNICSIMEITTGKLYKCPDTTMKIALNLKG
jgi:hypothetical protein